MSPTPTSASNSERSKAGRIAGRLFSWQTIRHVLIALAWAITLIALFYGEENWRGHRAWEKYRRAMEAGGARLDFSTLVPKPLPDDQNFAATPFVRSWFSHGTNKIWDEIFWEADRRISDSKLQGKRGDRHFRDLVAFRQAFAAVRAGEKRSSSFESSQLDLASRADAAVSILQELKIYEPILTELRTASQRPSARYPIKYDFENPMGILLPHLSSIIRCTRLLTVKACAELAIGQSKAALEDVKLTLYLADSVKEEPFLVSGLVRMGCVRIAASALWEGLAEGAWTEQQLQQLQGWFEQYNFVAHSKAALEGERAMGILTLKLLSERKAAVAELFEFDVPPATALLKALDADFGLTGDRLTELLTRSIPSGWYHLEQVHYCKLLHSRLETKLASSRKRILPTALESRADTGSFLPNRTGNQKTFPSIVREVINHQFAAQLLLTGLDELAYRCAVGQVTVGQAAIACALERYRLAKNEFPEALEGLLPQFMSSVPHDVLTGESFKYRRTDDGRFVLYSIGWNGKDDGGVPGATLYDETQGDWVWRYPSK